PALFYIGMRAGDLEPARRDHRGHRPRGRRAIPPVDGRGEAAGPFGQVGLREGGHRTGKGDPFPRVKGRTPGRHDAVQRLDLVDRPGTGAVEDIPVCRHVGYEQGALRGKQAIEVADARLSRSDEAEKGARVQVDVGDRVLVVGGSARVKVAVEADKNPVVEPGRVAGGGEADLDGAGNFSSQPGDESDRWSSPLAADLLAGV